MTSRNQLNNKAQTLEQETVVNKVRQQGQKDHQEALLSKRDDFIKLKQKLLDETQQYKYQQSSKFSSVSRNLILGVIGTIWVLTYTDGRLCIPNEWLFCCIIVALLFLLVDVIHYFMDSMSYQNELYLLEMLNSQNELESKHEPRMNSINKRSHRFLLAKFCILLVVFVLFAIGLLLKMSYI
ncbi:MAG: hypothetical protein E7100_00485 [Bacteroidaceae bacterium]|jgi:hypothetical protein|nr:hypothetical protein [Bacteroidaceae bacterium]